MRLTAILFVLTLAPALPGPARADQTGMCDSPPCTREELETYERRVVKHLLRVQQLKFEAHNRGDKKVAERYEREFKRTQDRRAQARRAIENAHD